MLHAASGPAVCFARSRWVTPLRKFFSINWIFLSFLHFPLSFHLCLYCQKCSSIHWSTVDPNTHAAAPTPPPDLTIKTHQCLYSFHCFILYVSPLDQILLHQQFVRFFVNYETNRQFLISRWPQLEKAVQIEMNIKCE